MAKMPSLENEFVDLMTEAITSDNLTKVGEFLNRNFDNLSNLESWITKSNTMPVNIKAMTLLYTRQLRPSVKERMQLHRNSQAL